MKTIKGPGVFLAPFAPDTPPHDMLEGIARRAKDYGYRVFDDFAATHADATANRTLLGIKD